MFEFIDEKLGRVKVINITEARASMALIMNDKEFNYVITKNNRPVRVIINYDTYKKSQLARDGVPTQSLKGGKNGEFKDPLKGLLEQKEKDLKKQVAETPVKNPVLPPMVTETAPPPPPEPPSPPLSQEIAQESASESVEADSPPDVEISTLTPPPSSDYFNRFRKLYEAPRYEVKAPEQKQEPVRPVHQEFLAAPQEPPSDLPAQKPLLPVVESPVPRRSGGRDLPSIQDLLMDLENEKLSDENDGLSSDQVNKLVGRLSK